VPAAIELLVFAVDCIVFCPAAVDLKILRIVIAFIAIHMMDHLVFPQFSAELILCHPAMDKYSAVTESQIASLIVEGFSPCERTAQI
jgi:hypothetical protein